MLWSSLVGKIKHETGRVQTDKRKKKCPSCNEMNPMSVKVRHESRDKDEGAPSMLDAKDKPKLRVGRRA